MRFGMMAAAAAAMVTAAPVSAATIVQTDNEEYYQGFKGFDSRLGTLLAVTLDIALSKRRVWQVDAPVPVGTSQKVDYTVDGQWLLPGRFLLQDDPYFVPLTGVGSSVVNLDRALGDRALGYLSVFATGRASLDLDPSGFIDRQRYFNGYDPKHFDTSESDTNFSTTGGTRLLQVERSCNLSNGEPWIAPFEDLCGGVGYRLTYLYDPIPATGVPEPTTWVMLLLGLAAAGYAMRRRTARLMAAPASA